ncbi:MAG: hypothetical protein IH846_17975 [Acidobacteria bacterium]|nr:hypothetical protein [Acidobacteriota bacterium]
MGHATRTRERFGRITDLAGVRVGCSGRAIRRVIELDKLVREKFGDDKADQLRQDIKAGTTAPVYKMLRAIKSQMAVQA